MLKNGDLIKGDWVNCKLYQNPYGICIPMRVLYTDDEYVYTKTQKVKWEDVSQIQLDENILVNFGFNCDGMYGHYDIDSHIFVEYYFYEHRLDKIYTGVDEWYNHAEVRDILFRANVRTVDELQHAFKIAKIDFDFTNLVIKTK